MESNLREHLLEGMANGFPRRQKLGAQESELRGKGEVRQRCRKGKIAVDSNRSMKGNSWSPTKS